MIADFTTGSRQARQQFTGLRGQFGERVVGEILANMGDPPISIDEDVRGQREA